MVGCQSGKVKLHQKITAEEQSLLADATVTPAEDSLAKVIIADYLKQLKYAKTQSATSKQLIYMLMCIKNILSQKKHP